MNANEPSYGAIDFRRARKSRGGKRNSGPQAAV